MIAGSAYHHIRNQKLVSHLCCWLEFVQARRKRTACGWMTSTIWYVIRQRRLEVGRTSGGNRRDAARSTNDSPRWPSPKAERAQHVSVFGRVCFLETHAWLAGKNISKACQRHGMPLRKCRFHHEHIRVEGASARSAPGRFFNRHYSNQANESLGSTHVCTSQGVRPCWNRRLSKREQLPTERRVFKCSKLGNGTHRSVTLGLRALSWHHSPTDTVSCSTRTQPCRTNKEHRADTASFNRERGRIFHSRN